MSHSSKKIVYCEIKKTLPDGSKKTVLQAYEIHGAFRTPIKSTDVKEPNGLKQFKDIKPTYKFKPKKRVIAPKKPDTL